MGLIPLFFSLAGFLLIGISQAFFALINASVKLLQERVAIPVWEIIAVRMFWTYLGSIVSAGFVIISLRCKTDFCELGLFALRKNSRPVVGAQGSQAPALLSRFGWIWRAVWDILLPKVPLALGCFSLDFPRASSNRRVPIPPYFFISSFYLRHPYSRTTRLRFPQGIVF